MSRKPLYPFYPNVRRIIQNDPEFVAVYERELRYRNVDQVEYNGIIEKPNVLKLSAWGSSDNGFCMMSGTFWRKEVIISDEQLQSLIRIELQQRAMRELEEEAEAEYNAKLLARARDIEKELGL